MERQESNGNSADSADSITEPEMEQESGGDNVEANASQVQSNPSVPEGLSEDVEKIKGDMIGNFIF